MNATAVLDGQIDLSEKRERHMDYFDLNLNPLVGSLDPDGFIDDMRRLPAIDSQASFNEVCKAVCTIWRKHYPAGRGSTSSVFQRLDRQIAQGAIENQVIQTAWGGVVVTRHQHPEVEKFLVVHQGGFLALEKHAEKDELLEVKEGAGVLLWRDGGEQTLAVHELQPGDTFHFMPQVEHCVIGTENLLLFERSTDPLGMDQDLLFVYTPAEG
jgi:mannose-6-phosphate isomerase-like protein (cupin superfamily)